MAKLMQREKACRTQSQPPGTRVGQWGHILGAWNTQICGCCNQTLGAGSSVQTWFVLFPPHISVNLVSTTCKRTSPWVCDPMEAAYSLVSPEPASCKVFGPRQPQKCGTTSAREEQRAGSFPQGTVLEPSSISSTCTSRVPRFPSSPLTTQASQDL